MNKTIEKSLFSTVFQNSVGKITTKQFFILKKTSTPASHRLSVKIAAHFFLLANFHSLKNQ